MNKATEFVEDVINRLKDLGDRIDKTADREDLDPVFRHITLSVRLVEAVHSRSSEVRHVRVAVPPDVHMEGLS